MRLLFFPKDYFLGFLNSFCRCWRWVGVAGWAVLAKSRRRRRSYVGQNPCRFSGRRWRNPSAPTGSGSDFIYTEIADPRRSDFIYTEIADTLVLAGLEPVALGS